MPAGAVRARLAHGLPHGQEFQPEPVLYQGAALECASKKALVGRPVGGEPGAVRDLFVMSVLDTVLVWTAAATCVPAGILLLEVLAALWRRPSSHTVAATRPRLAVVVPAHDEAHGIATTLSSLRSQLAPGDRLLVVADNCSDATAVVARSSGAEVVERCEPLLRGKGHAMAAGVGALEQDPPDVVVFVDADCMVGPRALELLGLQAAASGRPVQADYRMEVVPAAPPGVRLLQFAWILRNHTRVLGLHRLADCCQLHGSGMAVPWTALQRVGLATGDLVEDLRLGIAFARAGVAPFPCPEAVVHSSFPASLAGRSRQRRRWEFGHLETIVLRVPVLFLAGILGANFRLLAMALDVLVPPLALLFLGLVAHLALGGWRLSLGHGGLPVLLAAGGLTAMAAAIFLGWVLHARHVVPAIAFLAAPVHVLRKLPFYLGCLLLRRPRWDRSDRTPS